MFLTFDFACFARCFNAKHSSGYNIMYTYKVSNNSVAPLTLQQPAAVTMDIMWKRYFVSKQCTNNLTYVLPFFSYSILSVAAGVSATGVSVALTFS